MKNALLIIFGLFILIQCSSDDDTPIDTDVKAPAVANVQVADLTNNGDGTDLEISFNKVTDESLLSEYRVFVVRKSEQSTFDLSKAEDIAAANYLSSTPDGTNKKFTLSASSNDSGGETITESTEYVVFVLSIADGTNAVTNALSSASPTISLEQVFTNAPKVVTILVDDIANNANGSDLEIYFNKVSAESLVSEYRVFVVRADAQNSFDLAKAEATSTDNYLSITPDGTDKKITLNTDGRDSDGTLISEAVEYVVFVMSVADGVNADGDNSLSTASPGLSLTQSTIKITYIGNDGVYISDGEKGVIIDALPGSLSGWKQIAGGVQPNIEQGNYPYDDIKVAMITHNHGDHVSSSSMTAFLSNNPGASLLVPSQIRGSISGSSGQIVDFTLTLDSATDITIDEIPIKIMRIRHFTPNDGSDFSSSESLAYLIELGGKKILHIGDGDLSAANFDDLGLENEDIDVALIPTFNFSGQLTTANRDVLLNKVAPANIIGLHLAAATPVTDVTNIYPDATVFTTSLEFVRY